MTPSKTHKILNVKIAKKNFKKMFAIIFKIQKNGNGKQFFALSTVNRFFYCH